MILLGKKIESGLDMGRHHCGKEDNSDFTRIIAQGRKGISHFMRVTKHFSYLQILKFHYDLVQMT